MLQYHSAEGNMQLVTLYRIINSSVSAQKRSLIELLCIMLKNGRIFTFGIRQLTVLKC